MNFEETLIGRPNTLSTYKSLFKKHIKNELFDYKDLNERSINNIINTWNSRGLSANTRAILVRLLNKYVIFLGGGPFETKTLIRQIKRSEQQREVIALSTTAAEKLMNTTRQLKPNFYPILLLALHAGLRRGEIFGLKYQNIDLINKKLTITRSYNGPTKNGKNRNVPISNELYAALTKFKGNPENHLFNKFDPNPTLKALCKKTGIPSIRFHDLRHTFASLALENGISPKQVSNWLGHSNVSTTLNIYWNLAEQQADLSFLPD